MSNGAWISINGGQTWTRYAVGAANGDDLGGFDIDPTDKNRIVATPHSPPFHVFESRDAGHTWTDQGAVAATTSAEYFWIDDDTLLAVGDGGNNSGPGTLRGSRSGSVWPWTWSWTRVSSQQHWHGWSQIFVDQASGVVFTGGGAGIQKSADRGKTWTTVSTTYSAGIVGTPSTLYSTANYANNGTGFGPWLMSSARATGGNLWTDHTAPAMTNGWINAAAVFDGTRWVIVSGNWNAGIWRHVE